MNNRWALSHEVVGVGATATQRMIKSRVATFGEQPMGDPMATLTKKEERTLLFAARSLFSVKSLLSPKSIRDLSPMQYFARELRLTGNRTIFLTESGYGHFRTVVDILDRADYFEGAADFSDISSAWRSALERWISDGLEPESASEVVQAISDLIADKVDDHTFVVPLLGVELDGADSFDLGTMTIFRLSLDALDSAGVKHDHANVSGVLEANKHYLWLSGTTRGTPSVAQQRFSEQATLIVGMLAVTG